MDTKYILAIDQGTSGTKAVLFDRAGRVTCRRDLPHKQYYPQEGWVEQDALEIWQNTLAVLQQVLKAAGAAPEEIACLSITDQTETFVLWDRVTGQPAAPAIVWQDVRAADLVAEMADLSDLVEQKTGIPLSAYYSAAKLKHLLLHDPALRRRVDAGEILFGTVECWLIWNLTGGRHVSDLCNASRSQLINIHSLDWDDELLALFGFPRHMFPALLSCDGDFGHVNVPGLPHWPICGVVGDSPGALFGQLGFSPGDVKVTYGIGSSVLMNLGQTPTPIGSGILTTIGWVLGGVPTYVCEGSIICSGATIRWLEKDLCLIPSAADSEAIAAQVPDTGGVYLVPAFTGLGGPWWDDGARAAILGMSRGTGRAHVVRAALESIAYQVKDAMEAIRTHCTTQPGVLRADGGASRNRLLMQFQSDILGQRVVCSAVEESSALGAAMIGGLAIGFWKDTDALRACAGSAAAFAPAMEPERRSALYAGWLEAVGRVRSKE